VIPAFRVVVADCPWQFKDSLPGKNRGATKNYGCLSLAKLKSFDLPPIADDAVLFLWRVSAMVEEAYEVARAWGFTPKSEIVWRKRTKTDKRHFGMGRYVRAEHETAIIATRGRAPVSDKSIRSIFDAPVGRHSAKPDEFFELVERLYPEGPYLEVFGRKRRSRWHVIGDQIAEETA
jgi:N6-adenosine-specific RNA methylase IME4